MGLSININENTVEIEKPSCIIKLPDYMPLNNGWNDKAVYSIAVCWKLWNYYNSHIYFHFYFFDRWFGKMVLRIDGRWALNHTVLIDLWKRYLKNAISSGENAKYQAPWIENNRNKAATQRLISPRIRCWRCFGRGAFFYALGVSRCYGVSGSTYMEYLRKETDSCSVRRRN